MRVLFYNWVDYLDAENRGGGVSIYQRAIMENLGARADVTEVFLCAGSSYDLRTAPPMGGHPPWATGQATL
ncbi:hypothetical protein ACS3SW_11590 [Roseobacteraceae bacterium S113]